MSFKDRLKGVKDSFGSSAGNAGVVGIGGLLAALIAVYGLSKVGMINTRWWAAPAALFFGGALVRRYVSGAVGDGMMGAGAGMGALTFFETKGLQSSTTQGPLNAGRAMGGQNAGYTNAGAVGPRFRAQMSGRPPIASVAAFRSAMSQTNGTVSVSGAGAAVTVAATMNRARNFTTSTRR